MVSWGSGWGGVGRVGGGNVSARQNGPGENTN